LTDLTKYPKERLGQAYCRMNCFIWDTEIFGPEPKRWKDMDNKERFRIPTFRKAMDELDKALTKEEQSMYWWTIELGMRYTEWKTWWNSSRRLTKMMVAQHKQGL